MALDLAAILNAIANTGASIEDATKQVVEIGTQQQEIRAGMTDNIRKQGQLSAVEAEAAGLGQLAAQENGRRAAAALGSNMDMSSEIITALGMRMNESAMKAAAALDQIKAKQSVGFLDNPIDWFINQVTVDADYQKYNMEVETYNQASGALAGINQATSSSAAAQNAIAKTVTDASIAAKVDKIKLASEALAGENQIRGFAEQQDTLLRTLQLEGNRLDLHLKEREIYNQEEQLAMRRKEFALSQETARANLARIEKQNDQEAEEAAEWDGIATGINTGRAVMGLPALPKSEVKRALKLGGAVADNLRNQYTIGMAGAVTGTPILANEPADAYQIVKANRGKLSNPVLDKFLKDLPSMTADALKQGEFAALKPAEQAQAINDRARKIAGEQQGELRKGDSSNLYKLPPTGVLLESSGLKSSALAQILKPVLETKQEKDIDPEQIISLAATATAANPASMKQVAKELEIYFNQAKQVNNSTIKYEQIGLSPQQAVMVRVEGKLYDLSKPEQLNLALIRQAAKRYSGLSGFGGGGMIGLILDSKENK